MREIDQLNFFDAYKKAHTLKQKNVFFIVYIYSLILTVYLESSISYSIQLSLQNFI